MAVKATTVVDIIHIIYNIIIPKCKCLAAAGTRDKANRWWAAGTFHQRNMLDNSRPCTDKCMLIAAWGIGTLVAFC
jgi:hypothetical protein